MREAADRIQEPVLKYYSDFPGFARDCVAWPEGGGMYPYQTDIGDLLVKHNRASLRSLRGAGKSMTAAMVVWWFALTRDAAGQDWKVVTTAGSLRELVGLCRASGADVVGAEGRRTMRGPRSDEL